MERFMTSTVFKPLAIVAFACVLPGAWAHAAPEGAAEHQHLVGNRTFLGTVDEVRSDQARVNTGEGQPRFVPMNVRKDKGLPDLQIGDQVEITVNDQNLLVDVHKVGEVSHHRIVRGQLAVALATGHETAVIRTPEGKEESHGIRPVARSKVASLPVGAEVTFLIDELNKIVDVALGTGDTAGQAAAPGHNKSLLKGNLRQVAGVITQSLKDDTIAIRTKDGKEQSFKVRPLILERLAKVARGQSAILLIDDEHQVADVSFNHSEKGNPSTH
jgi:hypothetical protein